MPKRDCARLRFANPEDVPALARLESEVWGEGAATAEMLSARIENAPNGNILAESPDGRFCGFTSFCYLDYEQFKAKGDCSWYALTGNGTASTHDPSAPDLFGINLGVAGWAPKDTSTRLLLEVVRSGVRDGVRRGILGARLPGFHRRAHKMTIEEYAWAEHRPGVPLDPEVRFYRKIGLRPIEVIADYFKDAESHDYGMLVEMRNPFRRPAPLRWLGQGLAALPVDLAGLIDKVMD